MPGTGVGESHLAQDAIELGMGIHNEPGFQVLSPIPTLDTLIPRMLDLIFSTADQERSFLPFTGKDEVVLLLNNLGGMSELELSGVLGQVLKELEKRGINVKRVLSGAFMVCLALHPRPKLTELTVSDFPQHARLLYHRSPAPQCQSPSPK